MTSDEHIKRAESLLAEAEKLTYSATSGLKSALAAMATAHVHAANFRKAEEDENLRTRTIRETARVPR